MGFKLSSSLKKKKFKKIQFRGASRIKRALLKTLDYLAVRTGNSVYHCALFMFIYACTPNLKQGPGAGVGIGAWGYGTDIWTDRRKLPPVLKDIIPFESAAQKWKKVPYVVLP